MDDSAALPVALPLAEQCDDLPFAREAVALSMAARRLPADWESRYHYRPVLLEMSYKAANWTYVGET